MYERLILHCDALKPFCLRPRFLYPADALISIASIYAVDDKEKKNLKRYTRPRIYLFFPPASLPLLALLRWKNGEFGFGHIECQAASSHFVSLH